MIMWPQHLLKLGYNGPLRKSNYGQIKSLQINDLIQHLPLSEDYNLVHKFALTSAVYSNTQ